MATRSPMRSQDNRREAAKRRIMGNFLDESSSDVGDNANDPSKNNNEAAIDGSNPDHVRLLIEDIETKFQQHLELLNADLFTLKKEQQQVHSTGILKLPKSIRQMTILEFNKLHSCDLLSLLKSNDGVHKVAATAGGIKKRDRTAPPVLETPAPTRFRDRQAPGTVLRTVRRGEAIYSQNGSPVDRIDQGSLVATVNKKRKGNGAATVEINVGDGKYISLSNPGDMKDLDSSMKATAASQLKILADQMASLMAQLTG